MLLGAGILAVSLPSQQSFRFIPTDITPKILCLFFILVIAVNINKEVQHSAMTANQVVIV